MRILVTGATGFVGRALCAALAERGHALRAVTRSPEGAAARRLPAETERRALPRDAAAWREAVSGCDAVVNLAGESIAAGRWTDARKREIRDSRVATTREIVAACRAARDSGTAPRILVSASAVGYYGWRGDEVLDESAPAGGDFLARVCADWEAEAKRGEEAGMRVVRARIGVVLGEGGGALERMVVPFRLFAGGPIGSGRQWMSWVHLDDVVGMFLLALEREDVSGAMNVTAPDARTMSEFCRTLGAVLHRPSWAPVPAFVLRLVLGEMADMLLEGQRVAPAVALDAGYAFELPRLDQALRAALHLS